VRLRLALGALQMGAAALAFALLLWRGVGTLSLCVVILTCLLTTVSVLLFGDRRR
jgi:hypothetical protein